MSNKQTTDLILWMRKNHIAWNSLTVGPVHIEGQDLKLAEMFPKAKADSPAPRASIEQKYGEELLRMAAESEGMTSVVQEDE